jgi:pimeloyl-ACP methyl ester carboxylesterase
MATARLNGVRLHFEEHAREGLPMILVHGSWDSHEDWNTVIPSLARSFRVIT